MMDYQAFGVELFKDGFCVGGTIYVFFWFIGYIINTCLSTFEYITKK